MTTDTDTSPVVPVPPKSGITHQLLQAVQISGADDSRFNRFFVPILIAIGVVYSGLQVLAGDAVLAAVSGASVVLLLLFTLFKPLQVHLLRRTLDRSHAYYIALFWVYSLLWVQSLRQVSHLPKAGKLSEPFYIFVLLFIAITFRTLVTLFGLTSLGNRILISRLPLWEKILIAINEFIAAGLLAYVVGAQIAHALQPDIFRVSVEPFYMGLLIALLILYYILIQMMWIARWNRWLSRNQIWVRLARLLAPLAFLSALMVVGRHFSQLSDTRTADLLGQANLDQTVLSLSPLILMLILTVVLLVYTGGQGLRQRFLPDQLVTALPERMRRFLSTTSDMDILLLCGAFATSIPLHAFLFDDASTGVLDVLRQQIANQNAIIDSSEQALAVIFALPFYILALVLMSLYAYALANPRLSSDERNNLVDRLPIGLVIILIIVLYLCAIPFSLVLVEGKLPQLSQESGRILAFDILIPLMILYAHYFLFIRIPYGRGQTRWRDQRGAQLERELKRTDQLIEEIQTRLVRTDDLWKRRHTLRATYDEKIDMLYGFIESNGARDHLNMERLRILDERQQLSEISESPVSLAIASLPTRIVSIGIPLLLAYKIYEWAVVNDGLREIVNNPNITVIEFFQTILKQAQF